MKRNNIYLLSFVFIVALFASCSTSEDEVTAEKSTANLNISTDINQTRAIITANNFSAKDSIGVFVLNDDGSVYNSNKSNVLSVYDGSNWHYPSDTITLSTSNAKVYGYYPFVEGATLDSVPIRLLTYYRKGDLITGTFYQDLSYTDYLFGSSSNSVNAIDSTAKLAFNHALTLISFQIPSSLKDNPNINQILSPKLSNMGGTSISIKGVLNVKTGIIKPTIDSTAALYSCSWSNVSQHVAYAKTRSVITYSEINFLVIPTKVNNDVNFSFVMSDGFTNSTDNVTFNIKIPTITWEAGRQYIYPIEILNNSTAELDGNPTILFWKNTDQETTTITNANIDTKQ